METEGKVSARRTAREEYRARTQQRQTVIFGIVGGLMAIILFYSSLVWFGLLPPIYDRPFSSVEDETKKITPCVPDNTQALDRNKITVRVYNATNRSGLAGEVGSQLEELGVKVNSTSNWGKNDIDGVRIVVGKDGIAAGYTRAQHFENVSIEYLADTKGEVVDIVIGKQFNKDIYSIEEVDSRNPGGILKSQGECTIVH